MVPAAVCAVLTLATLGDPLVLVFGIAPLAAACVLRLARNVAAPRWYEAWLAGAAVAAGGLGAAAPRVIALLGGYQAAQYDTRMAGLGHLDHAAWVTVQQVLELFGANVITARPGIDFAFTVLRLTGVILVVAAFMLAAARLLGPGDLLVPVLVLGIAFSLAVYLVSAYGQSLGTIREIAAVMPLGAALAGRVLAGPLLSLRGRLLRPVLAVAGAGYALALIYGATQSPASPANEPLATWLSGHGLRDGLAAYWQANSTTLDSSGQVLVSFAGMNGGRLAAASWETRQQDYDPRRHDATFVVAGGPKGMPGIQAAAEATFGPPLRVYHADGYTILVWGTNLLRRLGPVRILGLASGVLLPAWGRADGRGVGSEPVHVGRVQLAPAVAPPGQSCAVEVGDQAVEALVPARRVPRGLAEVIEGIGEGEQGSRAGGLQLDPQQVGAPGELHDRGRIEDQHLAVEPLPAELTNRSDAPGRRGHRRFPGGTRPPGAPVRSRPARPSHGSGPACA